MTFVKVAILISFVEWSNTLNYIRTSTKKDFFVDSKKAKQLKSTK